MERTHEHAHDPARRDRIVETTGTGTVTAVPELVVLRLAVQLAHDHVEGALRGAGELMTRLHTGLRDLGIPAERLRTDAVAVHPRYDVSPPRGYESMQALSVVVRTDDEVEVVLRTAVEIAGDALVLHGLEQALADPDALRPTAQARAVEDARGKAEHLAGLLDCQLGRVLRVREGTQDPHCPQGIVFGAAPEARALAPVERGQLSVTADVTICWELLSR